MKMLIRTMALTMLAGLLLPSAHQPRAAEVTAAELMAAYMRHIAALTTWPDEPAARAGSPIVIGVIGADPNGVMQPIRARLRAGEVLEARGRPISVIDLHGPGGAVDRDKLLSCALLFVSEGARDDWRGVRNLVRSRPIVTVSEMSGFADEGGMVEYFVERRSGKVRMKVSLPAMRDAGVSFSARLLALKSVIVLGEREDA